MEIKVNSRELKRLREEKSWSQEHLAGAASLSLRTIQRVETDGNASPETRLALACALGVDVADLNLPGNSTQEKAGNFPSENPKNGFFRHALIYGVVCGAMAFFDASHSGTLTWAQWPILGWGLGSISHGFRVRKHFGAGVAQKT